MDARLKIDVGYTARIKIAKMKSQVISPSKLFELTITNKKFSILIGEDIRIPCYKMLPDKGDIVVYGYTGEAQAFIGEVVLSNWSDMTYDVAPLEQGDSGRPSIHTVRLTDNEIVCILEEFVHY